MAAWPFWTILGLGVVGLAIDLYFTAMLYPLPAFLTRFLSGMAGACGVDGGICKRVFGTKYARVLGGIPTVLFGLAWHGGLVVLAAIALFRGAIPFRLPVLVIAWVNVGLGIYLTWVLTRVLREP